MTSPSGGPFALLLGVAQDGGHPQPGCRRSCCVGAARRHLPVSVGLVAGSERWLLDCTPALGEQLARLDAVAPSDARPPGLGGIFLTHAHIGHYLGLASLGREVLAARGVPVWVMPRMRAWLSTSGPWEALVRLGHVELRDLHAPVAVGPFRVEALPVSHRDEYSETVAFRVTGPARSLLYLPDVDAWDPTVEGLVETVDVALVDGTFWDDHELERDLSEIPHPRVRAVIERLAASPLRDRLRFVHLNHSNPLLDPESEATATLQRAGFAVGTEGDRFPL